jgi:hypothetical protein
MSTRFFSVLVVFLALAAAPIAAAPDDVRLSIDGTGAIVVPVTINGQRRRELQSDRLRRKGCWRQLSQPRI